MSQDVLLTVMNSMSLFGETVNMDENRKESCNLEAGLLKSQNAFNDLLKSHSQLEKHCISLECSIQLNQEIFQKRESCDNQNALEILEFFENNDLKDQLQDKDSTICKLREAHLEYLKYTQEQADILRGIVEQAKAEQPLDKELDFACKHAQRIQELLVYVRDTCPNAINLRLKCSTSKCGSKPTGNKRNDRISQTPSRNMKNKVEAQPRKVNKKNCVDKPIHDVDVKHSLLNANSEPICATCKKSLFDGVHDMCHVFTEVGLKWKPTGRTFTIVGNSCPLTRITSANVVPPKKTTSHSVETQKPELKVYSRKPKNVKNIVLWYLDFGCSKHMTRNPSQLMNFVSKVLGTVRFRNDHIARIIGYSDYQLGNVTISRCVRKKQRNPPHQPKAEDTNQEKLYLLHMDLCGPMRVASINRKRYILVIVDDYSRFTWTLREFYENVGISHQTSVARTPQQNGVVERRNQTLVEAARTMLIFSKAPLFLWAEAINTACYTQNRSIIRRRYNKTPYELMQDKKLDLSFFYVFGALCYPTNDNDDLGKLDAKADIGIFVGYAPAKKAFRIYNKRTQKIIETIHVTFDELTAMASEQFSLGPGLQCMTPATSSSGLVPNTVSQQPCIANQQRMIGITCLNYVRLNTINPPINCCYSPVQDDVAQELWVLAILMCQFQLTPDAPSASIPSTKNKKHSPKHFSCFVDHQNTNLLDGLINESPMKNQLLKDHS
ncbi:retrovirus-related pol polyprotein from transposon TNT 1-94 [Tanacetum coccineum]